MATKYELLRYTNEHDATVEWTYDNEREAVEQAEHNVESSPGETWQVQAVTETETRLVVWNSRNV